MKRSFFPSGGLVLAAVLSIHVAQAETVNWPQYRGAASDGIGEGATLPERWSETENVVWRTKVPGWGWSSRPPIHPLGRI